MKRLFIILLSIAFASNAQVNTLNKLDLTVSTPASVAYSLRLLSSSYTGPLVRIKVGTSFYDVYPESSTNKFSLNSKISAPISTYNAVVSAAGTNALSTIISGAIDATVAIWYDQSGNGVHVLSGTSTAKIITAGIVNTIYGQPTIYFSGSNGQSLLTSSNSVDYSALSGATVNAVAQNVSTTSSVGGIIGAAYAIANPGYNISYGGTGSGYLSDGAGCEYKSSYSSTTPQIITNKFLNNTTNLSNTYINGVLKTNSGSTCSLTHTNGSKIYIGSARGYGPFSFNGNISEAIIFPKQVSSGEQTLLETSQTAFYYSPLVTISSSAPNNTSCSGTSVTFTATSYNFTSTPTYQWYKNNVAISGATSSTYVTSDLVNNDVIHVIAVEGGASVSTTGLVLNLDAGNSSSYTSGATSWTDLTGKGNHGTLNNVTYSSSNQGYLSFNGTTSYVSLPNSTDFNFDTGDFTIELWAQNSSATKTPNLLAINSNNSFYSAVRIGWAPNINSNPTMTFNHSTTGNSWSVQTGYTGSFSNWTQIVISRTAGVVTMYANGVNKGTYNLAGSLMTTTTSNPINNQIGTLPNYQSIYTLLGNMSIVRYYKAAGLTSSQVIQNYNAICSRYGLSAIGATSNAITSSITAGPTVSLTVTGDACVNKSSLSATTGLSSYAWYKDDAVISGATTNTYTPSAAGAYKVSVSNGTCVTTSSVTTINTCGVTADGKMVSTTFSAPLVSSEGGANFGTTMDEMGKIINNTGLTTTKGAIGTTTAVISGVISATNAITSSIGVVYSTDANFGTSSTSTIQSNVVAGTYAATLTGLTASTNYYAKSYIVNKAGTSFGPVVNFTTSSPPPVVGDVYGGGIVFYVLQSGDNGYDANVPHGLIAPFKSISRKSTNPLPPIVESQIGKTAATISGALNNGTLLGKTNTDAIIANQGSTGTYAALYCRNYANPTSKTINGTTYIFPVYTDWYMPSIVEINKFRAYLWSVHPSRGTYFNYGNNLIYYRGTSGNDNDYAWGKMLSSTMIGDRYKLYYVESGNEDGSTAYNGWGENDRLVVMPIRSF